VKRGTLAILVGSAAALTVASRLCLTRAMWNGMVSQPAELRRAVLTDDGHLVADVESTAGTLRIIAALGDLDDGGDVRNVLVVEDAEELPPLAVPIEILGDHSDYASGPAPPAGLTIFCRSAPENGLHRATLFTRTSAVQRNVDIHFRLPVDWTAPAPYAACLLTPFTWVVDLGAIPVRLFGATAAAIQGRTAPSVWCSD
jgi:hypothetical protein